MTIIQQGLIISLLGLLLTFLALGLLILTMVVLQKLFKPSDAVAAAHGSEGRADAEIAAVLAAAIMLLRAKDRGWSTLGRVLEGAPGRWWQGPPPSALSPRWNHADERDQ